MTPATEPNYPALSPQAEGKVVGMKRKLLDMSMSNPLLNYRPVARSVSLAGIGPHRLTELLHDGEEFTLTEPPATRGGGGAGTGTDDNAGRPAPKGTLYATAAKTGGAAARSLTALYRDSRRAVQETGYNPLYLALNTLVWTDTTSAAGEHRAPLALVPVKIEKTTGTDGYKISLRDDDEPQTNLTLLQTLQYDHNLDTSPVVTLAEAHKAKDDEKDSSINDTKDDHIDVDPITAAYARLAAARNGWRVEESITLDTFSFKKYLMWRDLDANLSQVLENPIMRHVLESGRSPYYQEVAATPPEQLDGSGEPDALLSPLPMDSSQTAAVCAARKGQNMIIIGPPGTGKSQVIANIIADAIGDGKTVLFVAEKAVALDVVHRRLEDVGIGEFCLNLHSVGSSKPLFVQKLRDAYEAVSNTGAEPAEATLAAARQQAQQARERLNGYVETLHRRRDNGLSLREAMELAAAPPGAGLRLAKPARETGYPTILDVGEELAGYESFFSPDPLLAETARLELWNSDLNDRCADLTGQGRELLAEMDARGDAADPPPDQELESAQTRAQQAASAASAWDAADWQHWSAGDDAAELLAMLEADHRQSSSRESRSNNQLSTQYPHPSTLGADKIENARTIWANHQNSGLLSKLFGKGKAAAAVGAALGAQGRPKPGSVAADLQILTDDIAEYGKFATALRLCGSPAAARIAAEIANYHANRAKVEQARTLAANLNASDAPQLQAQETESRAALDSLTAQRERHRQAAALTQDIARILELPWDGHGARAKLAAIAQAFERSGAQMYQLVLINRLAARAADAGLGALAAAVRQGDIAPNDAPAAAKGIYARSWVSAELDADPQLREFSGANHEQLRRRMAEAHRDIQNGAKAVVRASVIERLAVKDNTRGEPGMVELRRLLQTRRPRRSIRNILAKMPDAITAVTPCLMMSPLSAAQFIEAGGRKFDLVIFDEASQVEPHDAVGAMARGKQVIVAGDPQQLPPTAFFGRAGTDEIEDDDNAPEDQESILDELAACSLPEHRLNWHYRSASENLITFSNSRYYNGRLITFPNPTNPDTSVELVSVADGIYDRGGSRTNRPEAEAIRQRIAALLLDPQTSQMSIGVVTFNVQQRDLIEDLLEDAARSRPELEQALRDPGEPLFVKNLENVQGDERDVIIFSICYGPDAAGRVTQNFGALNRQGGERRLNVAATRSRRKMLVFSSIGSDRINPDANAQGVRDLKSFLEFAEHGPAALIREHQGSVGDYESPFEEQVAARLEALGWECVPQVGASAYRIDIGVKEPGRPGRFVAGVECDGRTYHSSATARDRDQVRDEVLGNMGWKIIRIWSTDWWHDPDGTAQRVHRQLQEAAAGAP